MSNPRAKPLTSSVLPAPRLPVRPMTAPCAASRPQRSPSAAVSSGRCEMKVAIGRVKQRSRVLGRRFVEMNIAATGEFAGAFLIAELQSGRGGDLPDARERHPRGLAVSRIDPDGRV